MRNGGGNGVGFIATLYEYQTQGFLNMGFTSHKKGFVCAAVGALEAIHNSRLLRRCNIYSDIENGHALPNR